MTKKTKYLIWYYVHVGLIIVPPFFFGWLTDKEILSDAWGPALAFGWVVLYLVAWLVFLKWKKKLL